MEMVVEETIFITNVTDDISGEDGLCK
jgi:hypothetical protein